MWTLQDTGPGSGRPVSPSCCGMVELRWEAPGSPPSRRNSPPTATARSSEHLGFRDQSRTELAPGRFVRSWRISRPPAGAPPPGSGSNPPTAASRPSRFWAAEKLPQWRRDVGAPRSIRSCGVRGGSPPSGQTVAECSPPALVALVRRRPLLSRLRVRRLSGARSRRGRRPGRLSGLDVEAGLDVEPEPCPGRLFGFCGASAVYCRQLTGRAALGARWRLGGVSLAPPIRHGVDGVEVSPARRPRDRWSRPASGSTRWPEGPYLVDSRASAGAA